MPPDNICLEARCYYSSRTTLLQIYILYIKNERKSKKHILFMIVRWFGVIIQGGGNSFHWKGLFSFQTVCILDFKIAQTCWAWLRNMLSNVVQHVG
jgi:hypothetical protein